MVILPFPLVWPYSQKNHIPLSLLGLDQISMSHYSRPYGIIQPYMPVCNYRIPGTRFIRPQQIVASVNINPMVCLGSTASCQQIIHVPDFINMGRLCIKAVVCHRIENNMLLSLNLVSFPVQFTGINYLMLRILQLIRN